MTKPPLIHSCHNCGKDHSAASVFGVCSECEAVMGTDAFKDWLRRLRIEMVSDGETPEGAERYGAPSDWLGSYTDGLTPREALDEDYSCA